MVVCPYCGKDISKCACYSMGCGNNSGSGGCNGSSGCSGNCSGNCNGNCENCNGSCKKSSSNKSSKNKEKPKESGVYCRACNDFNKYADPDMIVDDGKDTCWNCRNHPERRKKGLPKELKDRIHEIFPIK
jgi:hypothetical protein